MLVEPYGSYNGMAKREEASTDFYSYASIINEKTKGNSALPSQRGFLFCASRVFFQSNRHLFCRFIQLAVVADSGQVTALAPKVKLRVAR